MSVTRYWAPLAWLGGDQLTARVALAVDAGVFVEVSAGMQPPADAILLTGITVPGLANAHSHAFHRALRGRTQGGGGTFWTWRQQMYAVADRLTPESYFALARATYAEMALAGITCVGEFHYLHHQSGGKRYASANVMAEALIAAAGEAGIRITVLDACYLAGGIGQPVQGPQTRFSDGDAQRWAERASAVESSPLARVGAAVHSVRAVPADQLRAVVDWAAARGAPLHTHLSEQRAENDDCLAAYGCSPTELLARHGALGPRTTAVHATHVSPADIALLGTSGSTICMCPTTERDLADGIGPAGALCAAGAGLSVGSDSNAVIDLWEEARGVELDERLASERRGHWRSAELLTAVTAGGHASLGWPEAGRIAAGAPADFVTVRSDTVRMAGAGDLLDALVFTASAADVGHVVVAGRRIVSGGRHELVDDVPRALAASIAAVCG